MWMAGGFQGRSWGHVEMLLPYSAIGIIGTILCARSLNALQLGDELAKSLGVRVMRMRTILIFLSALLAAVSVSVAGMLGFVGLIVPHIMRLLIGSDHEYLLPCAAIAGGAVVTLLIRRQERFSVRWKSPWASSCPSSAVRSSCIC